METKTALTAGSMAAADVASLLRSRASLIWIVTREEARVERCLIESAQAANYAPVFWDVAGGMVDYEGKPSGSNGAALTDPVEAMRYIGKSSSKRQLFVMRDLPSWLRDPTALRVLRSLAKALPQVEKEKAKAIVVLTPDSVIPPELAGHAVVVEWPIPDRNEITAILDSVINALPENVRGTVAEGGVREAAIDAAVGLTAEEASNCYARSLVLSKKIDPLLISKEKKRVIAREKVLEWIDPLPGGLDSVGGLEGLKSWLTARKAAFGPRARAYGLPAPKGCLIVGIPGTGKSLTAKAVATSWGMPLLRLDLGALKAKWVGESEGNIRKALRVAEAVSPCVVWLEEIEKALSGATSGAADGGVSADALGTILSWMQERSGSVFVVATANDVTALPPELLRKGRFDEIFFVDLPTFTERVSILKATLASSSRATPSGLALEEVAQEAQEFTGSELAALIPDALYAAFADGERDITTADLLNAVRLTVPLAKTASEKIGKLREWAKGRARPASLATEAKGKAPSLGGRDLDFA